VDRMSPGSGSGAGLTLVELVASIAVVAVTLALGAPSLKRAVEENRVRSEVRRLVTAINLARSEAVLRNSPVSLCPSAVAATGEAVCSGHYAGGWMVFSNRDRDRVVDEGSDQLIRAFDALPAGFTLTNRAGTRPASELVTYLSDGSSRRNLTFLICPPGRGDRPSRSIVINRIGRARVARDWGQCPGA